jgi:nucleotide-binding universal stress UspA family protein
MNAGVGGVPRLVVGISRSRASWWALAWAVGEARRREANLLLVNVFRLPAGPSLTDTPGFVGRPRDPYAERVADGNALIRTAIDQAVGQMPGDVQVEWHVASGRAAAELAGLALGGDLLVFGCRHRGWLRRFAPGSVARACARRAACPVVVVPEPSPRDLPALLPTDSARSHKFRWMPHRGAQTASS